MDLLDWILAGVGLAAVGATAYYGGKIVYDFFWKTFVPFVKRVLEKAYRWFRCFVKWVKGKFFGEVVVDDTITYEQDIDESEVPEEYRWVKYSGGRVDVTDDKCLRLQLGL